jgi:hypothetical protein
MAYVGSHVNMPPEDTSSACVATSFAGPVIGGVSGSGVTTNASMAASTEISPMGSAQSPASISGFAWMVRTQAGPPGHS